MRSAVPLLVGLGSMILGCTTLHGEGAQGSAITVRLPTATAAPPEATAAPEPSAVSLPPELHAFAEGWNLEVATTPKNLALYDNRPGNFGEILGGTLHITRGALSPLLVGTRATVTRMFGGDGQVWALLRVDAGGPADWGFAQAARRSDGGFRIERSFVDSGYDEFWIFQGDAPSPYTCLHGQRQHGGSITRLDRGPSGSPVSTSDLPALTVDSRLLITGCNATKTGYIAVLGQTEDELHHGVQRFSGGSTRGRVAMLPDPPPKAKRIETAFCLGDKGTVHVLRDMTTQNGGNGQVYASEAELLTWDGAEWTVSALPEQTAGYTVVGCAVAADGAVWVGWQSSVTQHGDDVRIDRSAHGVWNRVAIPRLAPIDARRSIAFDRVREKFFLQTEPIAAADRSPGYLHVEHLWSDSAGTVWVTGTRLDRGKLEATGVAGQYTHRRRVIFRSGPPRPEGPIGWFQPAVEDPLPQAVDAGNAALAAAPTAPLPTANADCGTPFVVLMDPVPQSLPRDYGFPEFADLIKQRNRAPAKLVEARLGGRGVLGITEDSYEAAAKLARDAVAGKKGKPAPPPILCGAPFVTRELDEKEL